MTMREDHDKIIRLEANYAAITASLDRIEALVTTQQTEGDEVHGELRRGVVQAQRTADRASAWSRIGTSLWALTILAVLTALGIRERPL